VLAFQEGAVKKSVGKLFNVLAFAEGAGKKVLPSLGMCWHLLKELLKNCWQAWKCVDIR
jgi:hypothetical protein